MNIYLATLAALVVYLVIAWFLGNLLHLHGRDLWVLRIGLSIIGVAAAAVFLWFKRKEQKEATGMNEPSGPAHAEVDALAVRPQYRPDAARAGRV